jgi:hypothetical protein
MSTIVGAWGCEKKVQGAKERLLLLVVEHVSRRGLLREGMRHVLYQSRRIGCTKVYQV